MSNIYQLEANMNPWRVVTNNFSRSSIENYIRLYDEPEDQLALLKRIEEACPKKEYATHESDFEDIRRYIKACVFLANYEPDRASRLKPIAETQEEYDRMFAIGYEQTMEAAESDKAEQYRQECNTLRYQMEEQRKAYEENIAAIENRHQLEIEELKHLLSENVKPDVKGVIREVEKIVVAAPSGKSLTAVEMAAHMKAQFSKSAAEEFVNMYYHLAMQSGNIDEETAKLIDSIVPEILRRDVPTTNIDVATAHQVNVNPQTVVNHEREKE